MNRAIQAEFAPGSTFKPIVALAGLETGVIDDKTDFHCAGGASFYGHYFACHLKRGHGDISLHRAIAQSCDVFFYNVGNRLGIDRIAQYAEMAGLGSQTGIDLPSERESTMPSTRWKLRNYRQKWYAGETISVAIGQGAVTVSPLELATAIGGISLGGKWMKPHMLRGAKPSLIRQVQFRQENVHDVIDGMYAVVNEGGTGRFAALPNVRVCGKTGSAQLASNQFLKGSKLGQTMRDNGWFVAFAPEEAPEIVVVALYENGEHGDRAAWVVRDVMKAYFDKKTPVQGPAAAYPCRPASAAAAVRGSGGALDGEEHPVIHRILRGIDWYLLTLTLIVSALGILQIYSATHGTKWQDAWWKQIVFVTAGLALMWLMSQIDYHALVTHVFPLYGATVGLLLVTLLVGSRIFGSTRWIGIAGFTFQVFGVRENCDRPAGGPLFLRYAAGTGSRLAGPGQNRRAGRRTNAAGDEAARSWHFADLPAHPGLRHPDGGNALEVYRDHCPGIISVRPHRLSFS